MTDATFETFLVSGLLVLIAAVSYMAWSAWRWVDRERDMEKLALAGVGHELRMNLKRMLSELASLGSGSLRYESEILPIAHPQLDALLSRPSEADRRGLTALRGNYIELSALKQTIKSAMREQHELAEPANRAADASISALAALYLWEEHQGRPAEEAHSTRSWAVRDWMKRHGFRADMLPGLHLRDQVVERLRMDGMALTPRPLTHTASEYFAMQYDRKADPNAPFWKRKVQPKPAGVSTREGVEPDAVPPAPDSGELPLEETVSVTAEESPAVEPEALIAQKEGGSGDSPAPEPELDPVTRAPAPEPAARISAEPTADIASSEGAAELPDADDEPQGSSLETEGVKAGQTEAEGGDPVEDPVSVAKPPVSGSVH